MQVSRGIETAVEEGIEEIVVDRYRYWDSCRGRYRGNGCRQIQVSRRCQGTIHQMQEQKLDLSTSCREVIEEEGAFSIYSPSIKKLSRLRYENYLRSSIDSNVSRRCQGGVELALKRSFSRSEKYRHECNPTYNSTNDPNTIKTHTHAKQV